MTQILLGATATASLVVALFFLRYWQRTHDRFFALFAVAFALMTVNRALLAVVPSESEHVDLIYGSRLLAFVVILIAIVDKNRADAK